MQSIEGTYHVHVDIIFGLWRHMHHCWSQFKVEGKFSIVDGQISNLYVHENAGIILLENWHYACIISVGWLTFYACFIILFFQITLNHPTSTISLDNIMLYAVTYGIRFDLKISFMFKQKLIEITWYSRMETQQYIWNNLFRSIRLKGNSM